MLPRIWTIAMNVAVGSALTLFISIQVYIISETLVGHSLSNLLLCSLFPFQITVSSCDLLVVSVGQMSMARAINILQKLWAAGIAAEIMPDWSQVSCLWVVAKLAQDLHSVTLCGEFVWQLGSRIIGTCGFEPVSPRSASCAPNSYNALALCPSS